MVGERLRAADAGRPWWEWAATYERAFSYAYDALGVLPPSAEPRATGHITQIVELIQRPRDPLGHRDAMVIRASWHLGVLSSVGAR